MAHDSVTIEIFCFIEVKIVWRLGILYAVRNIENFEINIRIIFIINEKFYH